MNIGIKNISFGTAYQRGSKEEIVSDGKVEDRFISHHPSFIREITDARIQEFCKTGQAPTEDWKAHPLGGFDLPSQSLFIEDAQVVLRSNGANNERHLIKAPFDAVSGAVDLEASTEGLESIPAEGNKTLTFKLPGGVDVKVGGVIDMDDPNFNLGNLLLK